MSTLNVPPSNRVAIGTIESPSGPVQMFISPEWARYFETLTERAGGVAGSSTTDLAVSAFEDAGVEEIKADMAAIFRSMDQAPRFEAQLRIACLEQQIGEAMALIGELRREVLGLQQGNTV